MNKEIEQLARQRDKVHNLALEIIKEKGYVTSYDITEESKISLATAASVLSQNADGWDFDKHQLKVLIRGYSTSNWIWAYTEKGEKADDVIDVSSYKAYRLKQTK